MEETNYYVIYCLNNYHNLYMNHKGDAEPFVYVTKFRDELSACEFLRAHYKDDIYRWAVVNLA